MNKRERFFSTIERRQVDRPAWWVGFSGESALKGLYSFLKVSNFYDFKKVIDNEIWTVEVPYNSPFSSAIYSAFDFAHRDAIESNNERTLTTKGFFADYEDEEAVNFFNCPDPEKYIDKNEYLEIVKSAPKDYPVMEIIWSAYFQDACVAFGMKDVLIKKK